MKILSIVSAKGGVGKTTTAVNLAAALAAKKKKVLLIDTDAQASATLHLGQEPNDMGTAALMLDSGTVGACSHTTNVPNLKLMPGSPSLAAVDVTLASKMGRERVLGRALKGARYDVVVIDCPPSQSLMTANALVASSHYVIPVIPAYLSLSGILDILDFVEEIELGIGHGAKLLGMLLCQVDYRKKGHREYVEGIRAEYKRKVLKTEIRTNAPLEVTPSHGKTIFQFAKSSDGAKAYSALATEIMRKL